MSGQNIYERSLRGPRLCVHSSCRGVCPSFRYTASRITTASSFSRPLLTMINRSVGRRRRRNERGASERQLLRMNFLIQTDRTNRRRCMGRWADGPMADSLISSGPPSHDNDDDDDESMTERSSSNRPPCSLLPPSPEIRVF